MNFRNKSQLLTIGNPQHILKLSVAWNIRDKKVLGDLQMVEVVSDGPI